MLANGRFPVLSIVAKIIWGIGIVVCGVGGLFMLIELFEIVKLSKPGAEWIWESKDIIRIVTGMSCLVIGIITMAIAEVIGVLFAIELNTRMDK